MNYENIGEGRPILMLHGTPVDHNQMRNEMEPIFEKRTGWKRIYPDMPGHGKTPAVDSITDSEGILKAVEDFIDNIIPDQRFVVAATSFGGYIARGLVHNRGSKMDGLFLNSPAIVQEPSTRLLPPRQIIRKDDAIRDKAKKEKIGGFVEMAVQQNESVLNYLRMVKTTTVWSNYDEDFLKKVQALISRSIRIVCLHPFLPRHCSYWVDRIVSVAIGMLGRSSRTIPELSFVVLDMAGHLAHAEQPRIWAEMVDEWVDRVEQWTADRAGL